MNVGYNSVIIIYSRVLMFRVLFVPSLFACTVQPINQSENHEEENEYPDGFQLGDLIIDPGSVDGNVSMQPKQKTLSLSIQVPLQIVSASIDGDSAFTLSHPSKL